MDAERWESPPPDECEEYEYPTPVGTEGDVLHFRHRWHILTGNMVDFAIVLLARPGLRFCEVARADIAHGELHVHTFDRQGHEIKHEPSGRVVTQRDVDESYNQAVRLMQQNVELYKRRWRDG
jgi:hypothetical protein